MPVVVLLSVGAMVGFSRKLARWLPLWLIVGVNVCLLMVLGMLVDFGPGLLV